MPLKVAEANASKCNYAVIASSRARNLEINSAASQGHPWLTRTIAINTLVRTFPTQGAQMSSNEFLTSESGHEVPVYGNAPDQPGVYLALFHGRDSKDQQMNEWGFNGPVIGPLEWVHTTYACHVRALFESADAEQRYFAKPDFPDARELCFNDDLIEYAGKFYGDWSVYYVSENETRKPPDTFRKETRLNWPKRPEIQQLAA